MKRNRILAATLAVWLLLSGCGGTPHESGHPSAVLPMLGGEEAQAQPDQTAAEPIPGPEGQTTASDSSSPEQGTTHDPAAEEAGQTPTEAAPQSGGAEEQTPQQTEEPGGSPAAEAAEPSTATEAAPTETEAPGPHPELAVRSVGLYDGAFVEDGSDETVESVAVLLVENTGKEQLQFAELHYLIDGREAVFRVSELPAGEKTMVLEYNRLVATPLSNWQAQPERDSVAFLAAERDERIVVSGDEAGVISVTNKGTRTLTVDVCYKLRYDEQTLLGGIVYHIRVEQLAAGETRTVDAAHYSKEHCELVRIRAE